MSRTVYEIRVVGAIGAAAREAFRDLAVEIDPATTVLTGELDSTQLHRVLDAVRDLGLELVEIRQAHARPAGAHPGPAMEERAAKPLRDVPPTPGG
jgi:hypothetical protein